MMSKGVVEDDVIAKLWQVYSKPASALPPSSPSRARADPRRLLAFRSGSDKAIPKFQRRGAIIVLGMFAGPKPEVVADHVETLLKIGLGPHGKVRLLRSSREMGLKADLEINQRLTSSSPSTLALLSVEWLVASRRSRVSFLPCAEHPATSRADS
jgi:hypothetical protein